MHKLGVVVPYRNRYEHLEEFKTTMVEYLESKNIDFEIIVVEQDDSKLFNRGMLLNIGFKYAKDMGCDYVVFHDVDMLPVNVDYSYSDIPLHLATNFTTLSSKQKRIVFDEYFGGVTIFPIEDFERINEFSINNGNGLARMTSSNITLNYSVSSNELGGTKESKQTVQNGGRKDDLFGSATDLSNQEESLFKKDAAKKQQTELYKDEVKNV